MLPTRGPTWSRSVTGTNPTERPHYGWATVSRSRNYYNMSWRLEFRQDEQALNANKPQFLAPVLPKPLFKDLR